MMRRWLSLFLLTMAAMFVWSSQGKADQICAPIQGFGQMARDLIVPASGTHYRLDGRGCVAVTLAADIAWLVAQGFINTTTSTGVSSSTVYSVDNYGAIGDGTTDDYAAFNLAATACALTGGVISIGPKRYLISSSNFTIPANCTVAGERHWPGNYQGGQTSYEKIWPPLDYNTQPYEILLNPARSIIFSRNSGLRNLTVANVNNVIPTDLQTGIDLVNGFSGTALKVGDGVTIATGSYITEVAVWGFNTCLSASYPLDLFKFFGDCINGIDIGTVANMGDETRMRDIEIFPWMTQNQSWTNYSTTVTGTANHGDGTIDLTLGTSTGLTTGTTFHVVVFGVTGTIEANGGWTGVVNSNGTINLLGSTYTNAFVGAGSFKLTVNYRSGFGYQVATFGCDGCGFTHAFEFGHAIAYHFGHQALYAYCFECTFDSPQSGDDSTVGFLIDGDASSISLSGQFHSQKGTGIRVDTSDGAERSHHMYAPRIGTAASGATFTNGKPLNSIEVLHGALTITGGFVVHGIHVGNGAKNLTMIGVDARGVTGFTVDNAHAGAMQIFGGQWPVKWTQSGPGSAENRLLNGDFVLSRIIANTIKTISGATYLIDGWKVRGSGLFAALTHQRATTGGPTPVAPPLGDGANHPYNAVHTVATVTTPTATDLSYFGNRVEGNQVADLNWGTTTAKSVVLSLWIKSPQLGDYAVAVSNHDRNRTYLTNCNIASASTWTYCSFVVPGDTTGTWYKDRNLTGIEVSINLGAGSDYVATASQTWLAGEYAGLTTSTSLTNTSTGVTLAVAGVRLRPGISDVPFIPKPFGAEMDLAQRYFQTSFPTTVAAAANSNTLAGARCAVNTIANGMVYTFLNFSPPMMTSPTITTMNPFANNTSWRNITRGTDIAATTDTIDGLGPAGVLISSTTTIPDLGDVACIHYSASSAL